MAESLSFQLFFWCSGIRASFFGNYVPVTEIQVCIANLDSNHEYASHRYPLHHYRPLGYATAYWPDFSNYAISHTFHQIVLSYKFRSLTFGRKA